MPLLRRSTFRRPNARDLHVHEQVLVLGRTQAEVARELKISQPMVAKIVRRMRDYHGIATEQERGEVARVASLQEQLRLRVQRMDHLYSEAMAGWRRSLEKALSVKTVETEKGTRKEQSLKVVPGDYRYLKTAAEMDDRKLQALEQLYEADPVYAEMVMLDQRQARLQLPRDYDEPPEAEDLLTAMSEATGAPIDVLQAQVDRATSELARQEAEIKAACAAERGISVNETASREGEAATEPTAARVVAGAGAYSRSPGEVPLSPPDANSPNVARREPRPPVDCEVLPALAQTGASLRSSPGHDSVEVLPVLAETGGALRSGPSHPVAGRQEPIAAAEPVKTPVKKVCPLVAPRLQSRAVLLAHGLNPDDYGGGYEGYDVGRRVCDYPEDLAENAERAGRGARAQKVIKREAL